MQTLSIVPEAEDALSTGPCFLLVGPLRLDLNFETNKQTKSLVDISSIL